jgi:hypothetical protein
LPFLINSNFILLQGPEEGYFTILTSVHEVPLAFPLNPPPSPEACT